jgi:hypothetical protein
MLIYQQLFNKNKLKMMLENKNILDSGYMVQSGIQGSWIAIEVTDCVQFDILD